MPSMKNPQYAVINVSAQGQTTIFSNPSANGFAYVWDAYMTVAGACNVVFYNGASTLTGNMNFNIASGSGVFDPSGITGLPMWTIDPNANLSMTSTATVQRSGWVIFSN